MAIDTSGMLARLSPIAPLAINPSGGGGSARASLRLQREQFEEQKRRNREMAEHQRLAEANEMARAQLTADSQRRAQEAAAAAKVQEQRLAAYTEFTKLNGQGDIEGARAMVPLMTSLGMGVDLEGEEGGLPRYRIEMDAAAAEQRAKQQAEGQNPYGDAAADLGYPEGDSGDLATAEDAGIGSTEDAFRRAQGASAFAAETGVPARGPDAPDFTGGVPKNVIDLGAMQASTMQRLAPALGSLVQAYPDSGGANPDAYRDSAMHTAQGVAGMGLPARAAVEQFKSLRSSPDSLISSEMQAQAQQGRFEQSQEATKDRTRGRNFDIGYKTLGGELGKTYNVPKMSSHLADVRKHIDILSNDVDSDDALSFAFISRSVSSDRGATTENDIKRATGMSSQSWLGQVKSWFEQGVEGGLNLTQKNAVIDVLKKLEEYEAERATEFLDKVNEQAGRIDPDKAEGLREYARAHIPRELRDAYEAKRKESGATGSGNFDGELDALSKASGLDPEKVRGVIRPESGGDPGAVNPQSGASGLIQFLPKVAESLGTTIEEIRKMTAEQQLPLVMKYLSERGITKDSPPGDYYMAVAAPAFIGKPDSTVVYPKGSKEWEQNPAWRPADGGDITVGDIKRYGGGQKKPAPAKSEKASRIEQLLKKGNY